MDEKITLSHFLSRWDIECYKDHNGCFYVEHNDTSDYFHGNIIKCNSIEAVLDTIPEGLVEDDLHDIRDNLGDKKIKMLEGELKTKLCTDTCGQALDFLKKAKELYPCDEEINYHYNIMNCYVNLCEDDIAQTNMTIAVIQAMKMGLCQVDVSVYQGFVMCQFGDNEFYFNKYASEATSMKEFLQNVCNGCSRKTGGYYTNDYDEYGPNEMARDIAETLNEMVKEDATEALYYLYLMEENLPEFYQNCIKHQIGIAQSYELQERI